MGRSSSSVIRPIPRASTRTAFAGRLKRSEKLSSGSAALSSTMGTSTVRLVSPAAKASTPLVPVKSAPASAVPFSVS